MSPRHRRPVERAAAALLSLAVTTSACTGATASSPSSSRSSRPSRASATTPAPTPLGNGVRDVGRALRMKRDTESYDVSVLDLNHDGWDDLLISHHGWRPGEILENHVAKREPRSLGFRPVVEFEDTIHHRVDRHGCAAADVNLDGLEDILCEKGAEIGTGKKWNELWIQRPEGVWTDEARAYGIQDVWGRGRFPTFVDLNHDAYPDLFLGNDVPRYDDHPTPNRTFVNDHGRRFRQVDLGVTRSDGDLCSQAIDYDHDGWEDLLVCGRSELELFRRTPKGFVLMDAGVGIPQGEPAWDAELVDVSGDHRPDLVTVRQELLTVQIQQRDHTFGPVVFERPLAAGHGLAVGDIDGDGAPDILVVEGCVDRANVDDVLLINDGDGRTYTQEPVPHVTRGCGDRAAAMDFDRDGRADFVVLNGGGFDQPLDRRGPDQVLTMGTWQPPR